MCSGNPLEAYRRAWIDAAGFQRPRLSQPWADFCRGTWQRTKVTAGLWCCYFHPTKGPPLGVVGQCPSTVMMTSASVRVRGGHEMKDSDCGNAQLTIRLEPSYEPMPGLGRLEFCVVRIHAWRFPQRWTADRASIVRKRNNQCMTGRSTAHGCLSEVGYSRRLIVRVPPHTLPWHVTLVMAHSCLPSPFQEGGQIGGVHTRGGGGLHGTSGRHPICGGSLAVQIQRLPGGRGRHEARDTSQLHTYLQTCTHHNTMAMQMTVVIK